MPSETIIDTEHLPNPSNGQQAPVSELDAKVELARSLPVEGAWHGVYKGQQVLELGLPGIGIGGITGALSVDGPSRGQMKIRNMEVFDEELRGKGFGKRLLQTFAAEAKQAGASSLVGDIISEAEIHNRIQTFGEDNVTFFEELPTSDGHNVTEVEIPLTREQAIQSLHRAHQVNKDATISARTSLFDVDTTQWELPVLREGSVRPNLYEQLAAVAPKAGSLAIGVHR